jgi:hypothetical protein
MYGVHKATMGNIEYADIYSDLERNSEIDKRSIYKGDFK